VNQQRPSAVRLVQHRGRFQAQGKGLEKSASWAQNLPLNIGDGRALLENLKTQLTKKELEVRKDGFQKCRAAVEEAHRRGGIDVGAMAKRFVKSYPTGAFERVDLEVNLGKAFI